MEWRLFLSVPTGVQLKAVLGHALLESGFILLSSPKGQSHRHVEGVAGSVRDHPYRINKTVENAEILALIIVYVT